MTSQAFVSRLFPRGARFEGRIHEQLATSLPRRNLSSPLWHDGYLETHKSDRNIQLLQNELSQSPDNPYFLFQLALEYSSLNQSAKAFDCLQKAYVNMRPDDAFAPNIVVDLLHAVIELKRFDIGLDVIEKNSPSLDDFPDYHFVCGLFYMNLVRSAPAKHIALLPKIEQSFKRCLSLGDTDRYKSVRGTGSFLAWYNLGTLYHVFGETAAARTCLKNAAASGYQPAIQLLKQLPTP
jgi:tetratricopeptide (TPR) repeat protein